MIYQIIYSSESTMPMQAEDLEELLDLARRKNGVLGISGALVYAERMFLQILEGPRLQVQALMARIARDLRHEAVTVLREGEVPVARFADWKMAYVGATTEQVRRWAGIDVATGESAVSNDVGELDRTAQFAQDIFDLLKADESGGLAQQRAPDVP